MAPAEARSEPEAAVTELAPRKPRGRPASQQRATGNGMDAEAMLRQAVAKMQAQGGQEAERLRAAIRKAVAVLEAAVTS